MVVVVVVLLQDIMLVAEVELVVTEKLKIL